MAAAGVVIVGAGQAGGRTALALVQGGYGGPVTLIGAEAELPYERPPLSKAMLAGPDQPPPLLAEAAAYAGVALCLGRRVTAIDRAARRVQLDDGSALAYDALVLATGGQPRRLPFDAERLHVLRTLDDARTIAAQAARARSVLVVGGGVIGLEVAATLRQRGLAVTVIEVGSRLLGRNVPAPVADLIAARHAAEGVEIRTGVRIRSLTEDDGIQALLSDGATITADFAVAGIGIVPDTALAQACGLITDDGVVVDAAMRSSDPAIFAVGDMAALPGRDGRHRRCETWANANATAERAAAAILDLAPPADDAAWFWTDQYDLNVQLAGDTMAGRIVAQRASLPGGQVFLLLDGARLAGAVTINAGRDMATCRRLLAAGAALPEAMLSAAAFDPRAARALLTPVPARLRPVDA